MYDVVLVGTEQLMGEVIQILGEKTVVQVYEETSGIRPGEPVADTGKPLTVELGPGLLGNIYDGVQRPLPVLQAVMGDFILRGVRAPGLSRDKQWDFKPAVEEGAQARGGQVLGTVQEAKNVEHRVLVPPNVTGKIARVRSGNMKVDDIVAELDGGRKLMMKQDWPVRQPRPTKNRMMPSVPLITGQRVMDFLFPIAKGGTAAIPGGFGTGGPRDDVERSGGLRVRRRRGLPERRRFLGARDPGDAPNREGVLGPRHRASGAATLPGDQLAHVVQPVRPCPGELVPDAGQRRMAEASAMGAAHLARGGGARGERTARRRGRAAPRSAADPRSRPNDPRDLPPTERVPSRRHVLSAGTAVQAHRRNQEVRGRGDEIARPRRAGEGHRRRQVP